MLFDIDEECLEIIIQKCNYMKKKNTLDCDCINIYDCRLMLVNKYMRGIYMRVIKCVPDNNLASVGLRCCKTHSEKKIKLFNEIKKCIDIERRNKLLEDTNMECYGIENLYIKNINDINIIDSKTIYYIHCENIENNELLIKDLLFHMNCELNHFCCVNSKGFGYTIL